MKCPYCNEELESVFQLAGAGGLVEEAYLLCSKCNIRGERKLWQELIHTRKALDKAIKVLEDICNYSTSESFVMAHTALAEIERITETKE